MRDLTNNLIKLSKDSDNEILKLVAECLGEIGALDFATLQSLHQNRNSKGDTDDDSGDDNKDDANDGWVSFHVLFF